MKNKISDLRNHMFAAIERLSDSDMTPEQVQAEIQKATAISNLGKVIVDSAKAEIMFAKLTGQGLDSSKGFLEMEEDGSKKVDRPPAVYSNQSPAFL